MAQKPQLPVAIALYQPDIALNLGSVLRLGACLTMPLHVIEPCGFPLDDKRIRRAGMDYIDLADWQRHPSWQAFHDWAKHERRRLLLFTTRSEQSYFDISYQPGDILLFGRESAGVPETVHEAADYRLTIPMQSGVRSLNLAMSAAMACGEVRRQLPI